MRQLEQETVDWIVGLFICTVVGILLGAFSLGCATATTASKPFPPSVKLVQKMEVGLDQDTPAEEFELFVCTTIEGQFLCIEYQRFLKLMNTQSAASETPVLDAGSVK